MCGHHNNFTTINFEIPMTYLQVWHDHKKYIKMSFLGDKHTHIYVQILMCQILQTYIQLVKSYKFE